MWIVLFLLSLLIASGAVTASVFAATPIDRLVAVALWLVVAVLFSGAAIVEAINSRAREILKRLPPLP